MKLTVEVLLDNAAFADDPTQEVKRIFTRMMAEWSLTPNDAGKLFDVNGNGVGNWRVIA